MVPAPQRLDSVEVSEAHRTTFAPETKASTHVTPDGVMELTMRSLRRLQVFNKTSAPCTVSVTFDNHKDSTEILEEQIIQAGESFHFKSKELNMGTWTVRGTWAHGW